jgi:transporter family protein
MWVFLAIGSAFFLGIYDIAKKESLRDNNVLMVLAINTLICSLIFIPFILFSLFGTIPRGNLFFVPTGSGKEHILIFLKAVLVLSSWILSYYGLKHIPITIAGPINATRPVIVLIGALTVFGEKLNTYQWIGIVIGLFSFFMLSLTGRKEGINFYKDKWIFCCVGGTFLGALSGLYDKKLLMDMAPMFVQSWFLIYQCAMMFIIIKVMDKGSKRGKNPFKWHWAIIAIAVSLCTADFLYFYSLSMDGSMISIVSMLRRSSVVVSFIYGALFLKEKNIKSKAIDLGLVLIGLLFLVLGSL